VALPSNVATTPPRWRHAEAIITSMSRAASAPTRPWISPTIWPRAASAPNARPAIAIISTSHGASANTV
jgi:hypothetical protein